MIPLWAVSLLFLGVLIASGIIQILTYRVSVSCLKELTDKILAQMNTVLADYERRILRLEATMTRDVIRGGPISDNALSDIAYDETSEAEEETDGT